MFKSMFGLLVISWVYVSCSNGSSASEANNGSRTKYSVIDNFRIVCYKLQYFGTCGPTLSECGDTVISIQCAKNIVSWR